MNVTDTKITHSPGPWIIGSRNEVFPDGEGGESFSEWLDIRDASGKIVAELPGHSQYARDTQSSHIQDANACLMVSSLDSLDALREVSVEITRLNKAAGETVFNPAVTSMVRAAIDKATRGAK
jgi:hypothetical protein